MESRSFIRALPAIAAGMAIGGLVSSISYLLRVYAEHSFQNPTLTMWAFIGATHVAVLGAMLALPVSVLAVLLWVRGRAVRDAVKVGLGYIPIPLLLFLDGIDLQDILWQRWGFERLLISCILLFVLHLGAWPFAGWATYKSAPWFHES